MVRSHVLAALKTVPSVAEYNVTKLIPIVINQPTSSDDGDTDELQSWSRKDRNDLLELFTKFKKISKVPEADELYDYLLNLLTSKFLKVQQLALDVLFNWNNPSIVKYRDNLKNLLDDTIFSDEISKFLTSNSIIEDQDKPILMPYVIRILFGRVQGSPKVIVNMERSLPLSPFYQV